MNEIVDPIPEVDSLLERYAEALGGDQLPYRNHVHRLLHFCFAFHPPVGDERERFIVAAVFHDLGLWTDGTVDYLPPSEARAEAYLLESDRASWVPEIRTMIREHHKVRTWRQPGSPLVEPFRRADWCDVTFGRRRFGLQRAEVQRVLAHFPNAGFHARLGQLGRAWFLKHPLNPAPMMRW
ncbi:MAG: hypothetical protein AAFZ65_15680 [Planctomycetota bacterium]